MVRKVAELGGVTAMFALVGALLGFLLPTGLGLLLGVVLGG